MRHPSPQKISQEFVDNLFSYPADRQIDKGKNITSLAGLIRICEGTLNTFVAVAYVPAY